MRVHRDGYIQTGKIELWLPDYRVRAAEQVGRTVAEGYAREVAQHLGMEISGAERFRVIERDTQGNCLVRIESSWVRPSRS